MAFPIQRDLVIPQGADFDTTFLWLTGMPEQPKWRGPWNADLTFVPRDVTSWDGVYYAATKRNRAAQPDVSPLDWDACLPVDLTGWSARMMAREHKTAAPALDLTDDLSDDDSGFTLGGDTGRIGMHVANETTDTLPDAVLAYDLELVSDDDGVTRFMAGQISVVVQVTR